jgi:GntR family transcriptional regulator
MDTFTPKYVIIQNYIIDKIEKGEYSIGDKIPSENELAKMFNVSRITSNKAVSDLEVMGIVERIRGKGTYIKSKNLDFNDSRHVLSRSFKISSEASEHTHKLVKIEKINSNDYLADRLNIKNSEIVYKITRTLSSDNEDVGIDYSYIPLSLVKGKDIEGDNFSNIYIHDYLKDNFNINPRYLHVHIDLRYPDKYEKDILQVPSNTPIILWESNIIDDNDRTIAFTTTVVRPDIYRPFITFEL